MSISRHMFPRNIFIAVYKLELWSEVQSKISLNPKMKSGIFFGAVLGFTLALVWSSSFASAATTSPVVHLTSGSFLGVSAGAPNNTDKWLGIPFAQPPVGALRFKAPVPIIFAPLGVNSATKFGNACPQAASSSLGAPVSEDCLFLNVGGTSNVACISR